MKKISFIPLLVFIVLSATLSSCELFADKNDDCDATKMPQTEEPIIYIKTLLKLNKKLGDLYIANSDEVQITGSIRKIYCNGKESGNFTINGFLYVDEESSASDLYLAQPYQYKFDNYKDKLILICRVKVFFENGKIYESSEAFEDYFFEDIEYDANSWKYYIPIMLGDNLQWYEVTSK